MCVCVCVYIYISLARSLARARALCVCVSRTGARSLSLVDAMFALVLLLEGSSHQGGDREIDTEREPSLPSPLPLTACPLNPLAPIAALELNARREPPLTLPVDAPVCR